jgi:integrase
MVSGGFGDLAPVASRVCAQGWRSGFLRRRRGRRVQVSFAIALHTGCRLRKTRIPLECVDFQENKIIFPCPKGGEERAFSIPMPTALRPLFEELRCANKEYTAEFPFQPSRRWQQFFLKVKNPHLCLHCLRV